MVLRIACNALVMLGVTVGLTVILSLSTEAFVIIWLSFTAVVVLSDWLQSTPQPPRQSVVDLFERIEQ